MLRNVLGIQQKLERHCLYDSRREIFPMSSKFICSLVKPQFSHIVWLCFGALLRNVSFWTSSSSKFGKVTQLSSRTMETGSRDSPVQQKYGCDSTRTQPLEEEVGLSLAHGGRTFTTLAPTFKTHDLQECFKNVSCLILKIIQVVSKTSIYL